MLEAKNLSAGYPGRAVLAGDILFHVATKIRISERNAKFI